MISVQHLTKRYGSRSAVDDLSFEVRTGRVTGFVGPNGAGKSTTMRMMVDLTRPDEGEVRYDGQNYRDVPNPARVVGAVLDARCMHPGRSARQHLRALAALIGVASSRVETVLALVGLDSVAEQRAGGYSLGMRQRLALAGALLGEPEVLMLDEPSNGLDPDGIRWLRELLRDHSNRGGTVFVSSHLIAELAMFADDLVVVGTGKLIVADTVRQIQQHSGRHVVVRADRLADLHQLLSSSEGADVEHVDGRLIVRNGSVGDISRRAFEHGIALTELTEKTQTLEDSLLELTRASTEFTAS